ncbi:2-oxoglutarate dehydrogenase, E2 component, dihydrolipoamide succinyltransferase [Homoserinimonas sp. OAct 916]|uniref:2-oxoglutarate dehydrogenase, E2 component, dihydrolipoamide succinyltransferase n=1 Tax=Homoserinimonas sp. OAct 916 TaxID=2211450 RepID=UPI000DBE35BD|nr:2-oxoglutarate dehydrogenase, E2 component, dihydrolipoamide succinyltransferase [Homoserinimonas sp. OAct 916]
MSESVNLPALGESVTEGTVTRWLKNVGDRIEVDEPLVEVSTDKVDTEIPSPIAGVIEEILVQEDETVEVGTALVRIGDGSAAGAPDEAPAEQAAPAEEAPSEHTAPAQEAPAEQAAPAAAAPAEAAPVQQAAAVEQAPAEQAVPVQEAPVQEAAPAAQQAAPAQEAAADQAAPVEQAPAEQAPAEQSAPAQDVPAQQAAPAPATGSSGGEYVTPLVRKLANESGVDLANVTGTGVGGRIRKQDVLDARDSADTAAPAAAAVETSPLRGTTQPMSRLRKVIAERAVISMQATAQLTSVVEVDVTAVAALRHRVKDEFLAKTGQKLSFLPFFTLAAAEALKAYPIVNATVDGDSIVYPDHENISIAVDTERGLLTPVIRNASSLDLAGLAREIADLAQRTRDNKLTPDELSGGTFTVTNTGSRGALFDTPLVFLPQSAILGTGIVTRKPAVVSVDGSDAIAVRSMVFLALSYDHRIVDGADAARFLVTIKDRLENAAFEADLGI